MHTILDGGYAPVNYTHGMARTEPIQHRADGLDTVDSLAAEYAVSPEAIRAANPQLGAGDRLPPGELVEIPPQPMSVSGEVDQGRPNHANTDVKASVGNDHGRITWQPDGASVKLTDKQKLELENSRAPNASPQSRGFSISVGSEASVTASVNQGDTHSTFSVSTQTQVSVSGEARTGGFRGLNVEGSAATGFESTYSVRLPGEATVEQAASVNPFDPSTIPVGGSVTLNGSDFTNTSLEASFRYIGVQTKVNDASGTSYTVERVDENTVRVTAGPTETINAFNGVGVDLGEVSVYAGREDQLHGAELQTAEFDISTPEGQAAFEHFNETGQIAHETEGVYNVATISRVDYSSQSQLRGEVGPLNVDLGGGTNLGSAVQVTYPDGSYSLTTDLSYGDNVPLTIEQRFDVDGNELPGERRYEFEISTEAAPRGWIERNIFRNDGSADSENMTNMLNWVLTGDVSGGGPVVAGETVTLSFTEEQMQTLMDQTQATVDGTDVGTSSVAYLTSDESSGYEYTTTDFAILLARGNNNNATGFIHTLYDISSGADGDHTNQHIETIDAEVRQQS